jgi:Pilus formation protein N terminal region
MLARPLRLWPHLSYRRRLPTGSSPNEPDADERQVNSKVTLPRRAVQLVRLPSSTQREVSFDEPYAVVNTSNHGVVDVDQITDRAVLLRALKQGNADLFSTILRANS